MGSYLQLKKKQFMFLGNTLQLWNLQPVSGNKLSLPFVIYL